MWNCPRYLRHQGAKATIATLVLDHGLALACLIVEDTPGMKVGQICHTGGQYPNEGWCTGKVFGVFPLFSLY